MLFSLSFAISFDFTEYVFLAKSVNLFFSREMTLCRKITVFSVLQLRLDVIELYIGEIDVFLLGQLSVFAVPGIDLGDFGHLCALDSVGAALAVAEIAKEFVDSVIAEGAWKEAGND